MAIGKSVIRKDAWDKVRGKALYTADLPSQNVLSAALLTSTVAHGRIIKLDTSKAASLKGVLSILTGRDVPELFGPLVQDRPALARDVVRYAGEPVAMVVALDEPTALAATRLIEAEYEPLPAVFTPSQALSSNAPLIHNPTNGYRKTSTDVYPEAGTNIASRYRIEKGDATRILPGCAFVARQHFSLPPSSHLPMETHIAQAEILGDGTVVITTSSQSPFNVRKQLSEVFLIPSGQIQVKVPFVGGGFGGKAPMTLEVLAYLGTRSVGGRPVRIAATREQDLHTLPSRAGLEADIAIGADENGVIQAAEMTFLLDCGAYTDIAPYMAKAIATDCSGPYRIENLSCQSLCVYTNHTYATSFRGFAHESLTFCVERTMDLLAKECGMDPLLLRSINAIGSGSTTPTGVAYSPGLIGDLPRCLGKLKPLSGWKGGKAEPVKENTVRAQGVACFWKTENPPLNASSGAIVTFNDDGSVNLHTGVVEMGSNSQTHLAQILAEKLNMDVGQVHVILPSDTRASPYHWKTVASLTEYMAGHAVIRAAEDIVEQLKNIGAQVLGCAPEDVEAGCGKVFSVKNPDGGIALKDIVKGYHYPDADNVGEPVVGRGTFMLKGLTKLDPKTGRGQPGPAWTLGAQVVEIEADLRTCSYRLISASTVMDVGKVLNPETMRAIVAGGMAMGMSMASREACLLNEKGVLITPNLRSYKVMHIGQEPDYRVDFVETPEEGSPYGVRSYSEHGILGIPAALANALSSAFDVNLTSLPLTPETIWKAAGGEQP